MQSFTDRMPLLTAISALEKTLEFATVLSTPSSYLSLTFYFISHLNYVRCYVAI